VTRASSPRNRHARPIQEASRDFAERGVTRDALPQRVGKPADSERPDVGELGLVEDLARHDDHRGLQFVHRFRER
jgi:hypothetical protein